MIESLTILSGWKKNPLNPGTHVETKILITVLVLCIISGPVQAQSLIRGGYEPYCEDPIDLHTCVESSTLYTSGELLDIADEITMQLAYTYAPILWFYRDPSMEEPFALIEADYFIDVSYIDSSGNYKLSQDDYTGAQTLQTQYNGVETPVYIRITTDDYNGDTYIVIQYWFHYLYNYGGSFSLFDVDHEGEWEMIEVILEYDSAIPSGVTYPEPYIVAYSRHSGGEAHRWENEWIEKETTDGYHPVAYIAYGTHAAYFQDLGWNEDLSKGILVDHTDMNFIVMDNQPWLQFNGKWGGQENSPVGPMFQEVKWVTPVAWGMKYLDNYLLHLERPGHLLVTNEEGQRIGFVGDHFVNEIHDAYAVVTDEHEYYQLPEDEYAVEISGFDSDSDYDVIMNEDGEATHISFKDELATHMEKAFSKINVDVKEYTLEVDTDGDGEPDLMVSPDRIIGYKDKKGHPYLLVALLAGILLLGFILYMTQKRIITSIMRPQSKRTRSDVVGYILEGVAAIFFIVWFTGTVTDFLSEYRYEREILQLAVGLYLLGRVVPAFKNQYTPGRKVQEVFTRLGWSFIVVWVVFRLLQWTGWVGTMDIGVAVDYFVITGLILLLIGYTAKFVGIIRRHLILQVLFFVVGGALIFFWGYARVVGVYEGYANISLAAGIAAVVLGILGRIKRPPPSDHPEKEP